MRQAQKLGCQALQLFLGNPRRWRWQDPSSRAIDLFLQARAEAQLAVVAAHLSYLPNLAAADPDLAHQSWQRLHQELALARRLGLEYLICHPGHAAEGAAACQRLAAGLARLVEAFPPPPLILLENTAGQRRELGSTWAELAAILQAGGVPLGLCCDTAHACAAGYDLTSGPGQQRFWEHVQQGPGLASFKVIHLNDSLYPCGTRRDRHWHLGRGAIGTAGLTQFLHQVPPTVTAVILETPKPRPEDDPRNLAVARQLLTLAGKYQGPVT